MRVRELERLWKTSRPLTSAVRAAGDAPSRNSTADTATTCASANSTPHTIVRHCHPPHNAHKVSAHKPHQYNQFYMLKPMALASGSLGYFLVVPVLRHCRVCICQCISGGCATEVVVPQRGAAREGRGTAGRNPPLIVLMTSHVVRRHSHSTRSPLVWPARRKAPPQ